MQAAVLESFKAPLQLLEVDVDEPAPDEILVRTAAAGVCHTDVGVYEGHQKVDLPMILGHEAAGLVERVGSAVTEFKPGDHVVVSPTAFCGHCEWCMRGQLHYCLNKRRTRPAGERQRLSIGGETLNTFVGLGCFAQQMLVYERAAVRIPDEMPLDRAALLGCAVLTGMGAVLNTAKVQPGQTIAVIGCGGVGLNVIQAARFAGASRIIAIERMAAKLERALEFGATDRIDASTDDPVAAVLELTSGGVDHAFEVVGRPSTIEQAFAMLRIQGLCTVVGVTSAEDRISLPPLALMSERRIGGTNMGSSRLRVDVPLYCKLYLDGRIKLDELLSDRIGLDQITEAMIGLDTTTGARSMIIFDQ